MSTSDIAQNRCQDPVCIIYECGHPQCKTEKNRCQPVNRMSTSSSLIGGT